METVLEINGLTKSYAGKEKIKKLALDDLSLKIEKGEIFGLLGPNGAGKTTLIKTIIGLVFPDKGTISIFEKTSPNVKERKRIGYLPEISSYYWFLTPFELLNFYAKLSGIEKNKIKQKIDIALESVELTYEKNHLIRTFSKGMQQRLGLAQALLHDPEFLILDEPFSGLDPIGRVEVRNILHKLKTENKTILFSSHELSEAELICNRICLMKKGKILKQGSMDDLLKEQGSQTLEKYFIQVIGGVL